VKVSNFNFLIEGCLRKLRPVARIPLTLSESYANMASAQANS